MEPLTHYAPSVGSTLKKLLAINPDLTTTQLMDIIRQSIRKQGGNGHDFVSAETIDEAYAIDLVRQTLRPSN